MALKKNVTYQSQVYEHYAPFPGYQLKSLANPPVLAGENPSVAPIFSLENMAWYWFGVG